MADIKKGTPEEHHKTYTDNTPSDVKSHAQMLFDLIGTGRDHALPRPGGKTDRYLRKLIEQANMT